MSEGRRTYCTLDHANKRKELAERSPYQFWLEQLRRESAGRVDDRTAEPGRRRRGGSRRGSGLRQGC